MPTHSSHFALVRRMGLVLLLVCGLMVTALPTVARASSAAAPVSSTAYYTVQPGDTLTAIARRYGVSVQALALANGLANANRIYTGQRLLIPGYSDGGPGCNVYTVQRGDTLTSLARYFGVTTNALAQANGIRNINRIEVGQRLCIPNRMPAPSPTYYTVQRGDTLTSIARRFGTTGYALQQLNRLSDPNRIQVGQVLRIG